MNANDLDSLWSLLLDFKNSDLCTAENDKTSVQTVLNMVTVSVEAAQKKERARLSNPGVDYDSDDSSDDSSDW